MNTNVVIKHCPVCPEVFHLAQECLDVLGRNLGMSATLRDGAPGEFTVLVNGIPVIEESRETLPTVEEVESTVRQGIPEVIAA
jgi:predicted Rdx family selenoprotein